MKLPLSGARLALRCSVCAAAFALLPPPARAQKLSLNEKEYFEARGLNVLVFSNVYDGLFSDAKISSVELIHHGVRTATNGDVRISPTPGQWDPAPRQVERRVDRAAGVIETKLEYPDQAFQFTLRVASQATGVRLSVVLDKPVPAVLVGKAGLNLEFLPSAYFRKSYTMDERPGVFPLHPTGPTTRTGTGELQPGPLARGRSLALAPEDPERHVVVTAKDAELALYDGRNQAQNGWFVVRTELPANKTGTVVEWELTASVQPDWIRPAVIGHSQLGYTPKEGKVAVVELDRNDREGEPVRLIRVFGSGERKEVLSDTPKTWGTYLRYRYELFDFSSIEEPGVYVLERAGRATAPFPIAADLYDSAWHATNDVYLPVAMDHMFVNEAYRVWHGDPHRDDARQAPVNHVHFDLYAQGPKTDTPFKPGEHIPGLNVGGWLDAGDFDLRTQTNYAMMIHLVDLWEKFAPRRDETTVDQARRFVDIHVPDGVPDVLQQIEHGALQLLAQFKVVGHAIGGIVEPDLGQYTHLGDAASKTDGLIFDASMKPGESDGRRSGTPDDRWAFTTHTTPLNYGSIGALAAASRALRGYRDGFAEECLATAKRIWDEEHQREPVIFEHGNTTGGPLPEEELRAAVELLLATKDAKYMARIEELWPRIDQNFAMNAQRAVRALPFASPAFAEKLRARVQRYADEVAKISAENPYGVPISTGGWAGSGLVTNFGITHYMLHRAFPDIVPTDGVFHSLHFLLGRHPGSDVSFVSAVGTVSKEVAYGSNRADFSFIPGGVVPGVLILKPDFPENKEDWPFLWGENEYVVNGGASYMYLALAADELSRR